MENNVFVDLVGVRNFFGGIVFVVFGVIGSDGFEGDGVWFIVDFVKSVNVFVNSC